MTRIFGVSGTILVFKIVKIIEIIMFVENTNWVVCKIYLQSKTLCLLFRDTAPRMAGT